ncbi:MAG: hypothetical protein ACJ76H_02605 [Bacteriovoracaceae bacterium]
MMHTFSHSMDMILTISVLSFWFLFPIGIFLSVSHVDKNTDQIVRLDHLRHESVGAGEVTAEPEIFTPHLLPGGEQQPRETGRAA